MLWSTASWNGGKTHLMTPQVHTHPAEGRIVSGVLSRRRTACGRRVPAYLNIRDFTLGKRGLTCQDCRKIVTNEMDRLLTAMETVK